MQRNAGPALPPRDSRPKKLDNGDKRHSAESNGPLLGHSRVITTSSRFTDAGCKCHTERGGTCRTEEGGSCQKEAGGRAHTAPTSPQRGPPVVQQISQLTSQLASVVTQLGDVMGDIGSLVTRLDCNGEEPRPFNGWDGEHEIPRKSRHQIPQSRNNYQSFKQINNYSAHRYSSVDSDENSCQRVPLSLQHNGSSDQTPWSQSARLGELPLIDGGHCPTMSQSTLSSRGDKFNGKDLRTGPEIWSNVNNMNYEEEVDSALGDETSRSVIISSTMSKSGESIQKVSPKFLRKPTLLPAYRGDRRPVSDQCSSNYAISSENSRGQRVTEFPVVAPSDRFGSRVSPLQQFSNPSQIPRRSDFTTSYIPPIVQSTAPLTRRKLTNSSAVGVPTERLLGYRQLEPSLAPTPLNIQSFHIQRDRELQSQQRSFTPAPRRRCRCPHKLEKSRSAGRLCTKQTSV